MAEEEERGGGTEMRLWVMGCGVEACGMCMGMEEAGEEEEGTRRQGSGSWVMG